MNTPTPTSPLDSPDWDNPNAIAWDPKHKEWYWCLTGKRCKHQTFDPKDITALSLEIVGDDSIVKKSETDHSVVRTIGGSKGYTNFSRDCHKGPKHILTFSGGARLFVGSWTEVATRQDWHLRIALGEEGRDWMPQTAEVVMFQNASQVLTPEQIDALTVRYRENIIGVQWPDYGKPRIGPLWWNNLVEVLCSLPECDIAMNCMGGHGRTGTALAILVALTSIDADDPIKWVRDNYCSHTIESDGQLGYIEKMLDKKFPQHQAKGFGSGQSDWVSKMYPASTTPASSSTGGSASTHPFRRKHKGPSLPSQPSPNPGENPRQAKRRRQREKRVRRRERLAAKLGVAPETLPLYD